MGANFIDVKTDYDPGIFRSTVYTSKIYSSNIFERFNNYDYDYIFEYTVLKEDELLYRSTLESRSGLYDISYILGEESSQFTEYDIFSNHMYPLSLTIDQYFN